MNSADRIGLALYNSNGPSFLDGLLGAAVERQKLAEEMGGPNPLDEQRKQDMHGQQLQFSDDKHQLDLQRMQMEMGHKQQGFDLQQLQAIQKQQEASAATAEQQKTQQQMAQQQQAQGLSQSDAQAQHQHRQNVLDARRQEEETKGASFGEKIAEQVLYVRTLNNCAKRVTVHIQAA